MRRGGASALMRPPSRNVPAAAAARGVTAREPADDAGEFDECRDPDQPEDDPVFDFACLFADDEEHEAEECEEDEANMGSEQDALQERVRAWKQEQEQQLQQQAEAGQPKQSVVDLAPLVDQPAEGMQPVDEITVDSGAGATVANSKHFPRSPVEPSPGSVGGQQFRAAQGSMVPNRGQMRPTLLLETGHLGSFTFQETDVVKPLLAVSDLNAKGNACFFDGSQSFILPKGAKELQAIRALVQKVDDKIPMHLSNGTFKLRTWEPESQKPKPPFRRQGS